MEWSLIKASCTLKWGRDGGDGMGGGGGITRNKVV